MSVSCVRREQLTQLPSWLEAAVDAELSLFDCVNDAPAVLLLLARSASIDTSLIIWLALPVHGESSGEPADGASVTVTQLRSMPTVIVTFLLIRNLDGSS